MTFVLRSTKHRSINRLFFEHEAWNNGQLVCGIDEVGRGCLAGPVVTAAVILPSHQAPALLKDSKAMPPAARVKAYDWITTHCQYALGIAPAHQIDAINIYQTTLYAMRKAFYHLYAIAQHPAELKYILIDAMPLTLDQRMLHAPVELHHFNYGESLSPSIAAASIVAKVTRDRLMEKISPLFPVYGHARHKGYAAPVHLVALKEKGPSMLHRQTFIDHIIEIPTSTKQLSLFTL